MEVTFSFRIITQIILTSYIGLVLFLMFYIRFRTVLVVVVFFFISKLSPLIKKFPHSLRREVWPHETRLATPSSYESVCTMLGQWAMCLRYRFYLCFYDFLNRLWNNSNSVIVFVLCFLLLTDFSSNMIAYFAIHERLCVLLALIQMFVEVHVKLN